ncbi:S8 family serine peptidase [Ideonella sp. 4Y16]|uniref:S8 family serine peptidase n=1 Tax=Ideonella alba TaxID=2824118 RepID=UPI001B39186F|nr:S8 family serine peptidase [Ideonella alba]MBQ0942575.1 S8 family serine peptidase [Ideonella alba]
MSIPSFKLSRLCVAVAIAAPAALVGSGAVAAEATVKLIVNHGQASTMAVGSHASAVGGRVTRDLSRLGATAVEVPASKVAQFKALVGAANVEVDAERTLLGQRVGPTATPVLRGAAIAGTEVAPYGIPLVQADKVKGTGAWQPVVCIIDSGIDGRHEDLKKNTMSGKNFTTSGKWNTDENGHGTHVAGTIAGVDNQIGVVGVNGKNQVILRINKVFDAGGSASSSTVADAMMDCLDSGANVVSMSLGGSSSTAVEKNAAQALDAAGILTIAAAGNGGNTAISYPAGFKEVVSVAAVDANKAWATFSQFNADVEIAGPGVLTLSSVPTGTGVIGSLTVDGTAYEAIAMTGSAQGSVSAPLYDFGLGQTDDTGVAGKVCLISRGVITFAEKVTRCEANGGVGAVIYNNAPGNFAGTLNGAPTTIPSMSVSQANGATLMTKIGMTADAGVVASNYAYLSGTSMATPHVSGVAALVWSFHPECTAAQIRKVLNSTAMDLGDPGRDDKFGNGLVQAKAALKKLDGGFCAAN